LLSLAADAYQIKTGNEFTYLPSPDFETYGNRKGWT